MPCQKRARIRFAAGGSYQGPPAINFLARNAPGSCDRHAVLVACSGGTCSSNARAQLEDVPRQRPRVAVRIHLQFLL